MKNKIVPAILRKNINQVEQDLNEIVTFSEMIHLDIADGQFVDFVTPPPADFPVIHESKKLFWHLMVSQPEEYLGQIERASIIAVHAETDPSPQIVNLIKNKGSLACLVLNPETEPESMLDLAANFDLVQIMTVQPGAQGRNFLFGQLIKISKLRGLLGNKKIIVDGGVNRATIEVVSKYRPDIIVIGSGIINADNPQEEYEILNRLVALG